MVPLFVFPKRLLKISIETAVPDDNAFGIHVPGCGVAAGYQIEEYIICNVCRKDPRPEHRDQITYGLAMVGPSVGVE